MSQQQETRETLLQLYSTDPVFPDNITSGAWVTQENRPKVIDVQFGERTVQVPFFDSGALEVDGEAVDRHDYMLTLQAEGGDAVTIKAVYRGKDGSYHRGCVVASRIFDPVTHQTEK